MLTNEGVSLSMLKAIRRERADTLTGIYHSVATGLVDL